MSGPQTVADVLEAAATRLEPENAWGQGGIDGVDGCDCADTAIFSEASRKNPDLRRKAQTFFAEFVGGHNNFDTHRWNDAPGRTQAEVVAKLREAAAVARSQEQGE